MLHPHVAHALAREYDADRRRGLPDPTHHPRRPRSHAVRRAVGYRLVVTGWRLLDPVAAGVGVSGGGAPPARTAGPRPA